MEPPLAHVLTALVFAYIVCFAIWLVSSEADDLDEKAGLKPTGEDADGSQWGMIFTHCAIVFVSIIYFATEW